MIVSQDPFKRGEHPFQFGGPGRNVQDQVLPRLSFTAGKKRADRSARFPSYLSLKCLRLYRHFQVDVDRTLLFG